MDKLPKGTVDPCEVVYRTLAGPGERYEIKVDEVLAHSEWTPSFSIAEQYHTDSLKVFLAGDAGNYTHPLRCVCSTPANSVFQPIECHPMTATV